MLKKNSLNLLSLIIIQGSNAILPLLIFPYALSVIGNVCYSKIAVSESIMFVVYAFSLYSFEVNGVSEVINIKKTPNQNINSLFSEILIIRLLILLLAIIFIFILSFFLELDFFLLLLVWMLYPLAYIIQSSYYYLATENNFPLAVFVIIGKFAIVLLIFTFVKTEKDFILIPLIIGGGNLLGSILSFVFVLKREKLILKIPSFVNLKYRLNEGKEIFLGNVSVLLIKDLNVLIIGVFSGSSFEISSYSIAEKLVRGLQALVRPVNQYFFPKTLEVIRNHKKANKESFKDLMSVTGAQFLFLFFLIIITILSVFFLKKTFKFEDVNYISLLFLIMSMATFFGVINFIYGTIGLNHLNEKKYFASSVFISGVISVIFSIILVYYWESLGSAINYVLAELLLAFIIVLKYCSSKEKKYEIE